MIISYVFTVDDLGASSEAHKPWCAQDGDRTSEHSSWRKLGERTGPSTHWTSPHFKPAGTERDGEAVLEMGDTGLISSMTCVQEEGDVWGGSWVEMSLEEFLRGIPWGASESLTGADTLITSLFFSEPPRTPPPSRRGHTLPWPLGNH